MRLGRSDLELEVLYNRIKRGDLDLQPDFQRGEVWDRARQTRLIDTILRRWYVPAVHIVREGGDQQEYVLDGQQRLRTIYGFFENEIRVAGKLDPLSEDLLALDGLTYDALPLEYQRTFQRFELTVITLTDFDPAEPSELFFRLNQQYSLTPPEKRNALFGEARDQVKSVVAYLVNNGSLDRMTIGFSNGRLAYDDVVARFCLALQEHTLRKHISNAYVEQFYRRDSFNPEVIDRAKVMGEILGNALHQTGRVKFNKATLFSWLIFIHSISWKNDGELAEFIRNFEAIRTGQPSLLHSPDFPHLYSLVRIYSDRASYRVLDVNSVLLRDLILHTVHTVLAKQTNPETAELLSLVGGYDPDDAEGMLVEFIEETNWGNWI